MSTNLQVLLRNALLNNTYDYSILHDTLKDTWVNSYSYLYQLQKNYIEYEEHTFISSDVNSEDTKIIGRLYLNKSFEACFDIPYDFIHVCNREEFKRSKFYNTTFTFNDMTNNPSIFHKLPIVLIGGKSIWDYKLYANNGKFTIILPFNTNFVISNERNTSNNDIIYLDHTIQLFIVDNILYERVELNKNHILNPTHKTLVLDTSLMTKKTDKEGIYFISVHIPNIYGENYELGTVLMPCTEEGNKLTCQLSQTDYENISKYNKNLFISVIFVNKLHSHEFYTGNNYTTCVDNECNLFVLQRDECVPYAMPIPVENLMVIRKRDDTLTYVKNTETVELYYPNIYRIKDADRKDGDIYYIYYFYKYAESLQYTPMYDFYYDFLKIHFKNELLEKIIDEIYRGVIDYESYSELQINDFKEIFNKILQAGYYNYRYGEIDFSKRYLLEPDNSGKDPIEYKDETLREWIAEDPNILREYIIKQNKLYNPVYHLWTKSIDLASRLRTSTVPELGNTYGFDLEEECYVFAFRNDNTVTGKLLNIRVFVDGLYVVKMIQKRHYFTDYLYIPKSLVTNDSYIEIEIFPLYEYHKILNFSSLNDEKEIQLLEPSDKIYPTAEDVYYISPSGHMMKSKLSSSTLSIPSDGDNHIKVTSTKATNIMVVNGVTYEETQLFDTKAFQMTSCYTDGEFDIKTTDDDKPVKFTRLSKFKIRPLDSSVLNTDIALCISKIPNSIEVEINNEMYPCISLVGMDCNLNFDCLRVFRNGRLVPKCNYIFSSFFSFPSIIFTDSFKKGDVLYIDITPYKYKEVYYQEEIPEGKNIIDLHGYLDKPFDIRYYDVYLNGRKLSLNNVFSISPWKISLVNLKSIYHLQIFEKERDYEYFGTEFKTNKYYYTIDDLLESSFISEEEKYSLIDKIINTDKDENLTIVPNENTEDPLGFGNSEEQIESVYFYLFYKLELIPKTYVNPDKLQFNKSYIKDIFSIIHDKYYINSEDSSRNIDEYNRRKNYADVYMLDPDIYLEGLNNIDKIQQVYSIGHLNDIDDVILNETVFDDMNDIE